jgi:hypothetical protein
MAALLQQALEALSTIDPDNVAAGLNMPREAFDAACLDLGLFTPARVSVLARNWRAFASTADDQSRAELLTLLADCEFVAVAATLLVQMDGVPQPQRRTMAMSLIDSCDGTGDTPIQLAGFEQLRRYIGYESER